MQHTDRGTFGEFISARKKQVIFSFIILLLGYGLSIVAPMLGTDDSAFDMYFNQGYSLRMGRVVLPVVQKIFDVIEFTPFWNELLAALLILYSAWIMAYILWKASKEKTTDFFLFTYVCVFISFPLINEIFIYSSMSVSIGLGYVCSSFGYYYFYKGITRRRGRDFIKAILFVWISLSLYESFVTVYFCLAMIVSFVKNRYEPIKFNRLIRYGLSNVVIVAAAVVFNKICSVVLIAATGLGSLQVPANKSVIWGEESILFCIKSYLKTVFYDQFLAGAEYLPIALFVAALLIMGICVLIRGIKNKEWMGILILVGVYVSSQLIIILQGQTYYRSCQSFAMIVGLAFAIMAEYIYYQKKKIIVSYVFLGIILIIQTQDLSKWFYLDYQRAQAESGLMSALALDLKKKNLDGEKIIFVYEEEDNKEFDYYRSYTSISSDSLYRGGINYFMTKFGLSDSAELMYQLNRKHNQTNCLTPNMAYGINAFSDSIMGPNYEIEKIMKQYFFTFKRGTAVEFEEAQNSAKNLDAYPKENFIKEYRDYVIVKVGL